LSTREVGKKFLEELKAQGPTLDRVGKVFFVIHKEKRLLSLSTSSLKMLDNSDVCPTDH